MADLSIRIEGIEEVIEKLGEAAAFDELRAPMERSVARLQAGLAKYPPQPPTDYRRTGALGRRWTTEVSGGAGGLTGRVGNNTKYAPYVQDARRQARWMRHWQTDEQVLRENEDAIVADFEREIERMLK